MRKFYKILTLALVLMAIFTAFTVVSLAEGESTKQPITANYGKTFDSFDEGAIVNDTYKKRNGLAVLKVQDNGNKYVLTQPNNMDYADTSSANWGNPQWDIYTSQYGNIVDYPYFTVEFDIMTLNGSYKDFSYNPRPYGKSENAFLNSVTFGNLGLSTVPYDWSHISIVIKYNGDYKFTTYRYVNGKLVGDPLEADVSAKFTEAETAIKISSMKFYPYAVSSVGMDNLYLTYFPAGYLDGDIDAIANYRYNYGKGADGNGYEFPYTYTKAWVGDTAYEDLGEAMEAATDGVTVKLTENTKEALIIDKKIILDTNVYDADGKPTGSFYTYEYKTSKGLVPTETEAGSGKYAFARSENAVDIIWDEACGEDCDCFEEFGGHRLTTTTTVLLGATPEFFEKIPTWDVAADYTQKKLIGWSYENDGTVDELLPISEADVTAGTIKLYPVYENVVYSFAVISKDATEYYVEEDFGALLSSAPSGATIKLVRDVYTEVATVQLKKSLTIDLNGHSLKRCFVYGNVYEATKNGDELVYDTTTVASTVANGGDIFFQYYAKNVDLTITSSTGGGTFYNFKMDADTWTYEGETVKRVSKAVAPARITNASESTKQCSNISITLNGGITVYASQLFYSYYASGTEYSITVDNVKYYKLDSTSFITSRTNYAINISITNSLVYAPNNGGDFVFLGTTNSSTYGSEHYSKIVIKNCDVIKSGTGWGFNFSNTRYPGTTDVIFDNCRLYDAGVESATTCDPEVVGINGTLCYYTNSSKQESIPVNHPEG
ncbi:MAG: hypothetical protein IKV16_01485, partial [Clostridia bacterium]|nr:hypothetical protein [Clostridia bacterium]